VGGSGVLEARRDLQAALRGRDGLGGELPLRGRATPGGHDRLGEPGPRRGVRFEDARPVARQGREAGNPAAHRAAADHKDALDRHGRGLYEAISGGYRTSAAPLSQRIFFFESSEIGSARKSSTFFRIEATPGLGKSEPQTHLPASSSRRGRYS